MDQDGTSETVRVLTPVVRMIPVSAWLVDLFQISVMNIQKSIASKDGYRKDLSKGFSRADGALGDSCWAVHGVCSFLE